MVKNPLLLLGEKSLFACFLPTHIISQIAHCSNHHCTDIHAPSYTYYCVLLCFDLLTPVACSVVKFLLRRRRLLCFVFAFRLSPNALYYCAVLVLRYANFG